MPIQGLTVKIVLLSWVVDLVLCAVLYVWLSGGSSSTQETHWLMEPLPLVVLIGLFISIPPVIITLLWLQRGGQSR